jgi:purine-nucleoside phosphorylase
MTTICVSACMAGRHCLYHGGYATFARPTIARLRENYEVIEVCPEMLGGLPCPRPPTRRRGDRLVAAGRDVTDIFQRGAANAMTVLRSHGGVCLALLLAQSPSCDPGMGIFGTALSAQGIPVIACKRGNGWERELRKALAVIGAPAVIIQPTLF